MGKLDFFPLLTERSVRQRLRTIFISVSSVTGFKKRIPKVLFLFYDNDFRLFTRFFTHIFFCSFLIKNDAILRKIPSDTKKSFSASRDDSAALLLRVFIWSTTKARVQGSLSWI